jgi:hypothetical protein
VIGLLVLSMVPIILAILDIIIERGGVITYAGVKIDFSKVSSVSMQGITVQANVGVAGQPVTDSDTIQILDSLSQANTSDVVVVDLEDGKAWWETRLLVLLAGAERLKKPNKVVFIAMDAGQQRCFQGWSHADDLLRLLIPAHPQYVRSLFASRAAARQWELVEPVNPALPGPPAVPPQPPWMQPGLATQYPWMAFEQSTGLPNRFLAEQLLAADLGAKVEMQEKPRTISLARLDELFRPVLRKEHVDQNWPPDRQMATFLESNVGNLAITQRGRYVALVSKLAALNEVVKGTVEKAQGRAQ